jgi:hypothetical protein
MIPAANESQPGNTIPTSKRKIFSGWGRSAQARTSVGRRELLEADGPRLGEDLEGANEEGAVGGGREGGGYRRRAAAAQVAGDGEEAPEAEHAGV